MPARLLAAAALLICAAALVAAFAANRSCLMIGQDGAWYHAMLEQDAVSRPPFADTGVDALSGSFDAYYPLRRAYLLPTALTMAAGGGIPSRAFFYQVYGVLLLLSVFAVGRATGFATPVAIAAGFLMASFAPPGIVRSLSQFFPLFELNPFWSQSVSAELLIVAALWALDMRRRWSLVLLAAAPTACLLLTILAQAPHVLFIVPTAGFYGAASLLAGPRRNRVARLIAIGGMVGVPAALGCATYYYGIINYTAFRFFPGEIEHPLGGWLALSTAFWTSAVGKPVIALGVAGAAWAALRGRGKLRLFGLTHLVATLGYFAVGVWMAFLATDYRGSWPVYFETGMWPFALLFAVWLGVAALRGLLSPASRWAPRIAAPLSAGGGWGVLAAIIIGVGWVNLAAVRDKGYNICAGAGFVPTRPNPITEDLRRAIAIRPGQNFRGLVATIDDVRGDKHADWVSLSNSDRRLWQETGNDDRSVGLWTYLIPTLFQYHTFITPPYYLMLTAFLSRPQDRQLRSAVVLTHPDPAFLRLLGVRYLITDEAPAFGRVARELPNKSLGTLRLVELADVNLGDYSPTEVEPAADFRSGIALMRHAGFDGRKAVVTDAALRGPFVAAGNVRLTYQRYGLRLQAASAGRSLLVLPAQFSHCWHAEGAGHPTLFRADLMQLGIGFSGSLDIRLVFRLGPIFDGACRVADLRDLARLHILKARPRPARP
jgi:hypothetical protein